MNCEQAKRDILLAQSGELSGPAAAELKDHIASCESCRAYEAETSVLLKIAGEHIAVGQPSASTIAAIKSEAASGAGRREVILFPGARQLIASAAAILVLLAAGFFLMQDSNGGHEARIGQVSSIVAMVGEDDLDSEDSSDEEAGATDLEALAYELLRMEGLALDGDGISEDVLLFGEALSIDLQSHNTRADHQSECV